MSTWEQGDFNQPIKFTGFYFQPVNGYLRLEHASLSRGISLFLLSQQSSKQTKIVLLTKSPLLYLEHHLSSQTKPHKWNQANTFVKQCNLLSALIFLSSHLLHKLTQAYHNSQTNRAENQNARDPLSIAGEVHKGPLGLWHPTASCESAVTWAANLCTTWWRVISIFHWKQQGVKLNKRENDPSKACISCSVTPDEFNPTTCAVTPDATFAMPFLASKSYRNPAVLGRLQETPKKMEHRSEHHSRLQLSLPFTGKEGCKHTTWFHRWNLNGSWQQPFFVSSYLHFPYFLTEAWATEHVVHQQILDCLKQARQSLLESPKKNKQKLFPS